MLIFLSGKVDSCFVTSSLHLSSSCKTTHRNFTLVLKSWSLHLPANLLELYFYCYCHHPVYSFSCSAPFGATVLPAWLTTFWSPQMPAKLTNTCSYCLCWCGIVFADLCAVPINVFSLRGVNFVFYYYAIFVLICFVLTLMELKVRTKFCRIQSLI